MDYTIMHNHCRFLMNNKWAGRQNHGDCLEYFYKEKRAMDWICIYIPLNTNGELRWKYFSGTKALDSSRGDKIKRTPEWFQQLVEKAQNKLNEINV
ncbi:hypothetical protein [Bacillus thuringiensis]|uniref:hypothetical protein n=1 Tax=Bacillus thuringiensis TaxID=1428 RepID=UPI0021D649E4|nr:hypothetical protein [Bacillus thuringiensis]MCU7667240.1 hypothetical protein [Bacillus thuringiensis]